MAIPVENDRIILGSVTLEEARSAAKRSMSTDEWYRQSRASRALDVALDRAERAITHVIESKNG